MKQETPRAHSLLFTNPPLTPEEVLTQVPAREARAQSPQLELQTSLMVPGNNASVERAAMRPADRSRAEEVQVIFRPPQLGVRVFPPSVPGELLDSPDAIVVRREEERLLERLNGRRDTVTPEQLRELEQAIAAGIRAIPPEVVEPYIPEHLPVHPNPEPLPPQLEVPRFHVPSAQSVSEDVFQATTIFAPENRQVLWDTSYPWGTNGRVTTGNGWGSGVLVGPRHLLTCSHVIVWNADVVADG